MIKRKPTRMKNESCDDPRELLLSLVDLGSIDSDEMLLACVSEMSDAECKRVLNSLSLPTGAELEDEDDMDVDFDDADVEPADDTVLDDADADDADDWEDDDADEGDADEEADDEAELEARIRKLERSLSNESRRRFDRR